MKYWVIPAIRIAYVGTAIAIWAAVLWWVL